MIIVLGFAIAYLLVGIIVALVVGQMIARADALELVQPTGLSPSDRERFRHDDFLAKGDWE